jgi:site-specific DNA-methyltransferase (cytosine-N4-specific)
VRRERLSSALPHVYWLATDPHPAADNRRVLRPYSPDMKRMIARGTRTVRRPSGHLQKATIARDRGGSIPGSVIACGNTDSRGLFVRRCKAAEIPLHPARMPRPLAERWIGLCSAPGSLMLDPFAGSGTSCEVAESLGCFWLASERDRGYAAASRLRFDPIPEIEEEDDRGLP